MIAVAAWAKRHGVSKMGRDYVFTEDQLQSYKNHANTITENGTTQLAKELGLPRETVALWARNNEVEKFSDNGREAYVFTEEQKAKMEAELCK